MACFLFFINCSKDSYDSFEKQSSFNEKDITFDRFKKESGLLDFENKFKIDGTLDAGLKKENTNKHVLNEFVIDTIVIKKLVRDKKTTYTFQVHPKNIKSNNIYNLTMFYKQGWQSILVELKPTKEYLLSLKQGVNSKFEGTISRLYQSNLSNSGKTSRSSQLNCTTIFVEFWHCTRTGDCASGTCDQCNLCVGYESYRLCGSEPVGPDPVYIDAGGSVIGGGSGGSGEGGTGISDSEGVSIIPNLEGLNYILGNDSFPHWANAFLKQNPDVSIEQFEYWFTGNDSFEIVAQSEISNPVLISNFSGLLEVMEQLKTEVSDYSDSNDFRILQNQIWATKTIPLTPIVDLSIEIVSNSGTPYSFDKGESKTFISNTVVGLDWVQNSMLLSDASFSTDVAKIQISGYILVGIKMEGLEFGIKQRKLIELLVDKVTGKICCVTTKNIKNK
ncbi:hypothetical protein [Flavobacterium sp.]|uniref:hypothetical protein n=1 Tax=Flavobacterium sp. TaxID=239 RepID=UPI0022C2695F|nr:hypothetical protein [Flavobacterium sp.]MCZ8228613.1 hypothetical protein [Flavobacterium sp.]